MRKKVNGGRGSFFLPRAIILFLIMDAGVMTKPMEGSGVRKPRKLHAGTRAKRQSKKWSETDKATAYATPFVMTKRLAKQILADNDAPDTKVCCQCLLHSTRGQISKRAVFNLRHAGEAHIERLYGIMRKLIVLQKRRDLQKADKSRGTGEQMKFIIGICQ